MWLQTGVTYQKLESPDRVDPTKTNILLIRSMNWRLVFEDATLRACYKITPNGQYVRSGR